VKIDLRYTGLSRADERRVKLAANAMAAHHLIVDAQAWTGARCNVLIIDSRGLAGAHALVRAREEGIPTLDLRTQEEESAEMVASVVWLTRSLRRILREPVKSEIPEPRQAGAMKGAPPGLVELATHPELVGKPVHARLHGVSIWLLPQAGRVASTTVSDQLNARARLGQPGWRFEALPMDRHRHPPAEISASLDTFYMEAAWQARDVLPRFPPGQYQLTDWPDLGAAAGLVDVLRVVRALLHERASLERIAQSSGLSESDASACLWALRASGLLAMQVAAPARPAPQRRHVGGLWTRLAAHFGLARAV